MSKSLLILVAGPYRSGTNDDPAKIAANVKAMTDMALELLQLSGGNRFVIDVPGGEPSYLRYAALAHSEPVDGQRISLHLLVRASVTIGAH